MDYAGYSLCSVEDSWTGQNTYHTQIFLIKPFRLVWPCGPLPSTKLDFAVCAVCSGLIGLTTQDNQTRWIGSYDQVVVLAKAFQLHK